MNEDKHRCEWAGSDSLYRDYHDHEWGVPNHDSRHLFEMLILEGAQAGLSWITVLKKRQRYRVVFDDFDPEKIARYNQTKKQRLLADAGIIRNRLKIDAAIGNAQAYLKLRDEGEDFSDFIWQFVDGRPRVNHWNNLAEIPAITPEAKASKKWRDLV